MSADARPISPRRFAMALEDLPAENLYSKAKEIQNSIYHLQRSNAQLQEYSDSIRSDTSIAEDVRSEGDKDCLDAIKENQVVIDRQSERVNLIRAEVERRGGQWHEAEAKTNGVEKDDEDGVGTEDAPRAQDQQAGNADGPTHAERPRLTDEELRSRLAEQLADDDGEDDDRGLHL